MRMPRHTQPDRTADDTSRPHIVRINPRVATYTTQQIDQPKPIRPATGSSRVCPDIHNPTNPAPQPSTTPSLRTPRMSRHTQHDKSARQEITETGSKPITYATAYATRQIGRRHEPTLHRQYRPACPDIHNPTDLAPQSSVTPSTCTPRMPRQTQRDRPDCARTHSHNEGRVGPNDCAEHCQASPCEDPLTHCRVRRHGPEYRAVQRGVV